MSYNIQDFQAPATPDGRRALFTAVQGWLGASPLVRVRPALDLTAVNFTDSPAGGLYGSDLFRLDDAQQGAAPAYVEVQYRDNSGCPNFGLRVGNADLSVTHATPATTQVTYAPNAIEVALSASPSGLTISACTATYGYYTAAVAQRLADPATFAPLPLVYACGSGGSAQEIVYDPRTGRVTPGGYRSLSLRALAGYLSPDGQSALLGTLLNIPNFPTYTLDHAQTTLMCAPARLAQTPGATFEVVAGDQVVAFEARYTGCAGFPERLCLATGRRSAP